MADGRPPHTGEPRAEAPDQDRQAVSAVSTVALTMLESDFIVTSETAESGTIHVTYRR